MKKSTLFKILLGLAALTAVLFLLLYFIGKTECLGPLLIIFFVFLAFGIRGNPILKGFSYTFMIFAAVTIPLFYPGPFMKWGEFELKVIIVPLLQVMMFGVGCQMSLKDFTGVVRMPKGLLLGLVCQFTIMPLVGFVIGTTFGFPPEVVAGLILVGSSPAAITSNVMSFIAKANVALSVTLTVVATILAPFITPLLMKLLVDQVVPMDFWFMTLRIINIVILPIMGGLIFNSVAYGKINLRSISIQAMAYILIIAGKNLILFQTAELESGAAFIQLGRDLLWFLVLPALAAIVVRSLLKEKRAELNRIMAYVSMAGIGMMIAVMIAAGRDSLLEIGFLLILACLLHNTAGYFLGYWICKWARMDEKSCRTIALEVGMQNGGLASGIALQMGKAATIGLAPAIFGPMMNITGGSVASWWRNRATTPNRKNNNH